LSRCQTSSAELLPLWLPSALASVPAPAGVPTVERAIDAGAAQVGVDRGPVEFDRVVPPSGNLWALTKTRKWEETKELLDVLFPALTALFGSAVGFYFGTKD
jgi:hypothetical protein